MIWFPLYLHCTALSLACWVPTKLPFSSLVATEPFLFWAFATAFLSSLILFSQLSARCSHSHPSGGSSTHFPEWLSLLILMNKWLLTSYGKTSLVRQGPDGVASTPLDWMVGTCAPFSMLIDLPWLSWASHRLVLDCKILHPIPVWGWFSHTTKIFSDTFWVVYNSTQFWCYLAIELDPTGLGLSPMTELPTPTSDDSCKFRLSSVLPTTPFFGLINLIKQPSPGNLLKRCYNLLQLLFFMMLILSQVLPVNTPILFVVLFVTPH